MVGPRVIASGEGITTTGGHFVVLGESRADSEVISFLNHLNQSLNINFSIAICFLYF